MSTLFKEISANQVCAVHGFSHVWCGILFIFDHSQLKDCTNKQKCGPFFRIYSKLENLQFKTVNKLLEN